MTYQENNYSALKFWRHQNPQAGITLLLSMLLLAAITTIAFSLAAVGFAEIATSTDLLRTEPILYSSIGVAEDATYGLKRNEPTIISALGSNCDQNFTEFIGVQSEIGNKVKVCNVNPSNDIEVEVPVTTNDNSGYRLARRLYLYDPAKSTVGASGYTYIKFKKTNASLASDIRIYICQLDYDCLGPWGTPGFTNNFYQTNVSLVQGVDLPEITLTNDTVSGCCSYEVIIMNLGSQPGYVEVTTYDKDHGNKGLPYLNKKGVEIQSAAGRLIRRLRVLVPVQ